MSVKAITPYEALNQHQGSIPDFVIKIVNEMLTEKYVSRNAEVRLHQKDVVARIIEAGEIAEEEKDLIYKRGYLDFEELFEEAGWYVAYDKSDYSESYDAYFVFERKSESDDAYFIFKKWKK